MKSVLFIFLVVIVCLTKADYRQEWVDLLKTLHEECKKETNVDDASFIEAGKTGLVDRTNRKLMDHILCGVKKTAFIDDEGNINMDVCKSHLVKLGVDANVADEVNQICSTIKSTKKFADLPSLISDYYECYHKRLPKNVFVS